ncbi:hypothetical protein GCM10027440_40140 [Nocardiopsis coralliicola]
MLRELLVSLGEDAGVLADHEGRDASGSGVDRQDGHVLASSASGDYGLDHAGGAGVAQSLPDVPPQAVTYPERPDRNAWARASVMPVTPLPIG